MLIAIMKRKTDTYYLQEWRFLPLSYKSVATQRGKKKKARYEQGYTGHLCQMEFMYLTPQTQNILGDVNLNTCCAFQKLLFLSKYVLTSVFTSSSLCICRCEHKLSNKKYIFHIKSIFLSVQIYVCLSLFPVQLISTKIY
jgi:hypothetical protein